MNDLHSKFQYEQDMVKRILGEFSVERFNAVNKFFEEICERDIDDQPPMRQMHFGGSYIFDPNRKQVALDGEFSKADLMRIAMVMEE